MAKSIDHGERVMIGRNLAISREMAGYSQVKVMQLIFGSKCSKQKNRISEIENGRMLPDAQVLKELCMLYSVSSDFVLGFTNESVLDANIGRAGMLYNSLSETLGEMVQSITQQLTVAGVKHINSLPKSSVLELIQRSKLFLRSFKVTETDSHYEAYMRLIEIVRECDIQLARAERDMELSLDHIAKRDEEDKRQIMIADLMASNIKRFRTCNLKKDTFTVKQENQIPLL